MARFIGLALGALALLAGIFAPTPDGLGREGLIVAGLVVLMAAAVLCECRNES